MKYLTNRTFILPLHYLLKKRKINKLFSIPWPPCRWIQSVYCFLCPITNLLFPWTIIFIGRIIRVNNTWRLFMGKAPRRRGFDNSCESMTMIYWQKIQRDGMEKNKWLGKKLFKMCQQSVLDFDMLFTKNLRLTQQLGGPARGPGLSSNFWSKAYSTWNV